MAKVNPDEWALNPANLAKLTEWAANGLTYEQIAKNISIAKCTLNRWRKKYPTIECALSRGRGTAEEEVISSLFRRCTGYDWEERRTKKLTSKDGKDLGVTEKTVITHHVPGDVKAQVFWLTNRKPEEWKTKREESADPTNRIVLRIEGGDDLAQ